MWWPPDLAMATRRDVAHLRLCAVRARPRRRVYLRQWPAVSKSAGYGATVLYYGSAALFAATWLAGAAAVWLLWRPASNAFFKPPGFTRALPHHL